MQIRRDLKNLKHMRHNLDALITMCERSRRMVDELTAINTTESLEEAQKIHAGIKSLGVDKLIVLVNEIEGKYMRIIKELDPLDQTLALRILIGGEPYWKVGRDVGYSERGAQDRVKRIVTMIAKKIL